MFGDSFASMVFPIVGPNETTQKIVELIEANNEITTEEVAILLNRSGNAIAKQIAKLKEQNKLKRIGPDKGGYWEVINEKRYR